MLLNEWMHRRKKLLTSWYFKEIILLYLQCVFPLGFKCRLYNSGSAQLQVLCTILGPHVGPIVSFYWFYMEYDLGEWWLQRCSVVVKCTPQHCMS